MKKLIRQGPDAYGLKWYKIYQIQKNITFRTLTNSIGEPNEASLRIYWGQVYRHEECMVKFQDTLKTNLALSSYVNWIKEGGGDFMKFYSKDFDVIFDVIAEALIEYEG